MSVWYKMQILASYRAAGKMTKASPGPVAFSDLSDEQDGLMGVVHFSAIRDQAECSFYHHGI
ncbi:MAG TPA: hypothetical protein VHP30_07850 [Ignavibacteriales bacterium]|nr:hypothetical protein [Ignavibacteriales bacterium]